MHSMRTMQSAGGRGELVGVERQVATARRLAHRTGPDRAHRLAEGLIVVDRWLTDARLQQDVGMLRAEGLLGLTAMTPFLPLVKTTTPTTAAMPAPMRLICNSLIAIVFPCAYAATGSASRIASSISTSTTLETPRSCIVTPTSCWAISMVILL